MDDQRTNREGSEGVAATPQLRFRFGMRMLLLLLAIFCVLCGYFRAESNLRQEQFKKYTMEQVAFLEQLRREYESALENIPRSRAFYDPAIRDLDAEIERLKREIEEK